MAKLGKWKRDNGPLGPVELNQFLVLVSAEPNAGVATARAGWSSAAYRQAPDQPDNHLMIPAGASTSAAMDHRHLGPDGSGPTHQ
jgi:hypothetical protein